jgi:hypothetical protein
VPKRGEVWLVDLGLAQKARPALILNGAFKESKVKSRRNPFVARVVSWFSGPRDAGPAAPPARTA